VLLRYPAIFLLGVFFSFGPGPFERIHLAAVNRSWLLARQAMDRGERSKSPLKRLPVRPPQHDPSTCIICAMLHAPLTVQVIPPVSLAPMARLGYLQAESPEKVHFNFTTCENCRGPPVHV
jgi:hypothetical protein